MFVAAPLAAHEVPDRVYIQIFVKQERGHLTILVRMPANALIDYLLPTHFEGNWVDLEHATPLAEEGANVWIANLLALREDDRDVARPELRRIRLSRVNDPAFGNFDDALARIQSEPLPPATRVGQDQLTVDALLQTPITAPSSRLYFQPRFARLGVVVDTTLTFLSFEGGRRVFNYQSDPPRFELDPGRAATLKHFVTAGFEHYFDESDYWLFAICIALLFASTTRVAEFAGVLAAAQALSLFIALYVLQTPFWLRSVCGTAIAACIVYAGAEAIIAHDARRRGVAFVTGVIFGYGAWIGLQPQVQFGGANVATAGAGFAVGFIVAEFLTLAACAGVAHAMRRYSLAPRRLFVVVAAIVIHVAWRRVLERADGLALVPSYGRGPDAATLILWALGAMALVALVTTLRKRAT
jgi:hypothetical protein